MSRDGFVLAGEAGGSGACCGPRWGEARDVLNSPQGRGQPPATKNYAEHSVGHAQAKGDQTRALLISKTEIIFSF